MTGPVAGREPRQAAPRRASRWHVWGRWHIWLGWAAGVPLLLWTASGLFMASRPIEDVRGEHLRARPAAVAAAGLTFPRLSGSVAKVALANQNGRAVWILSGADETVRRFDARSGQSLGPVDKPEARVLADAAYAGNAALASLTRFPADAPPLELRRPRPAWQARFADGTHVYIDADSGEVLALRTGWWRAYDLMWGLHIMDLQTREDTSHPLLWLFGALAFVTCLIGSALLLRKRRRPAK